MARVVALVPDLFFASKVEATLHAGGHEVTVVDSPQRAGDAPGASDLVIVDLGAKGPDTLSFGADRPRLGFYSHVDVETKSRAEQAGFDLVVPRSRMAREMLDLVAELAGGQPE